MVLPFRQSVLRFDATIVMALLPVVLALSAQALSAGERSSRQRLATDEAFHTTVLPIVREYCIDCHGKRNPKGDISFLDLCSPSQVLENRQLWEKAFKQLGIGGMPPTDEEDRPTRAEQMALVEWLDLKLYHCDCDVVDDVGRETIQRLNRTEYTNTVRDLLGVETDLADDFPSDDVGYGFSNIGDVLSLPPLLFEKYVDASEKIAAEAIPTEPLGKQKRHQRIVFTRPSDEKSVKQALSRSPTIGWQSTTESRVSKVERCDACRFSASNGWECSPTPAS